jgi:uncharacterized membrane protein YeaQ/YmgE (transglycosylase-associated protein family)
MLHIIWSIIIGFIVGWIANMFFHAVSGFWMTAIVGVVGSIIGGLIGGMISKPADGAVFHPAGFFMSIIGAVILLFVLKLTGIHL